MDYPNDFKEFIELLNENQVYSRAIGSRFMFSLKFVQ